MKTVGLVVLSLGGCVGVPTFGSFAKVPEAFTLDTSPPTRLWIPKSRGAVESSQARHSPIL